VPHVLDTLRERGFVEQTTDDEGLARLLEQPQTCYIGFDPTAPSLHAGSLEPIMSLVQMQQAGHRPIVLVGGGTGLIGDPSGKTEMRRVMSTVEVAQNAAALRKQLSRYLDFTEGRALLVNNADWLANLNYIEFLRDIGRHFSVNRMLSAESYRQRLEQEAGLNFIEFNYMLLQAYDFWYLYKHYGCLIQMGGADQWGNICAGIDLTRRLDGPQLYGITFPLLTTSSGAKMGKTGMGAVWLDPEQTSPYDYYQYWINTDDQDTERFLALFTLLPMSEVRRLGRLKGENLRLAKQVLAFEATVITHGKEAACKAKEASESLFGSKGGPDSVTSGGDSSVPTTEIDPSRLEEGIPAWQLLEEVGLCRTRAEARRLINQGGAYVNEGRIEAFDRRIGTTDLQQGALLLRAGKKRFHRIRVKAA